MRAHVFAALVALSATASALEAQAPGAEWKEANREDDLVIFTKDNANVGTRDIVAITEADAPPKAVYAVVTDFENYAKFMPYTKEAKLLSKDSETRLKVYSYLSPPLVDDRDYVIDVTLTPGDAAGANVWKSSWVAIPDAAPARDKVVRVRINTGSWLMEPLDGGKRTRITYTLSTHPGGSIPTFVANKSNTVAIPDLFKIVRSQAAKRK